MFCFYKYLLVMAPIALLVTYLDYRLVNRALSLTENADKNKVKLIRTIFFLNYLFIAFVLHEHITGSLCL